MRPSSSLRRAAVTACLVAAPLGAQTSPASVTIRTGRVLDGRGGTLRNVTIVVQGDTIARVGRSSGATVAYDLSRYTVLPGLIDGHAHVGWHFNPAGRFHAGRDGETVV